MNLKLQLQQKNIQRQILSPQMRQSLHILQLPMLELKNFLEKEITENPLLDIETKPEKDTTPENLELNNQLSSLLNRGDDEENTFYQNSEAVWTKEDEQKRDYQQKLITKPQTLQEYLMIQLRSFSYDPACIKAGEIIAGSINEDGYLIDSLKELAELSCLKEKNLAKALALIQSFEPPGIGARDLKECLLIQLKRKNQENTLAFKIIEEHLEELKKRTYKKITLNLKVDLDEIIAAVKLISHLEPKPGRAYADIKSQYIFPDITLRKENGKYEISLNEEELPRLHLAKKYRALLKRGKLSPDEQEYMKNKIQQALWLIKAVAQRQETIKRITRCIIESQEEFFEKGNHILRPLTMEEVAQKVDRHKSTVSRTVLNKYIHTPLGVFALRYFFEKGMITATENSVTETITSKEVHKTIKALIEKEDKKKPLADGEIAASLKKEGINIARRTIAKYRDILKIPPSTHRKTL